MRNPGDGLRRRVLTKLRELGCDADHAVHISELRHSLRLVERDDLYRVLLDLEETGALALKAEDLATQDDEAVPHPSRGPLVLVRLAREPETRSRESWPDLRARVLEKVAELRACPGCKHRPIARLRRSLPDVSREQLDRALVILELSGALELLATDSPDSLQPVLRRGAIDGHDRGLLTYIVPKV